MNSKEIIKLLMITQANYPQLQGKDLESTAELWQMMLADIPFDTAKMAIQKVLTTAKFFPTIAEIREAATTVNGNQLPGPGEAWGEVTRLIGKHGYTFPDRAKAECNPHTWKVIQQMGGWTNLCQSEEPTGVLRGHFIRLYEDTTKREHEKALLPENVRTFLEGNQVKMIGGI